MKLKKKIDGAPLKGYIVYQVIFRFFIRGKKNDIVENQANNDA